MPARMAKISGFSRPVATTGQAPASRLQGQPSRKASPHAHANAHGWYARGEGWGCSLGQEARDLDQCLGIDPYGVAGWSGKGDETAPPSRPATHCESAGKPCADR